MTTIEEFDALPLQDKLTWIWETLVCRIDPMCEQILEHIEGENE